MKIKTIRGKYLLKYCLHEKTQKFLLNLKPLGSLQLSGVLWKCLETLTTATGAAHESMERAESSEQPCTPKGTDTKEAEGTVLPRGLRGGLWAPPIKLSQIKKMGLRSCPEFLYIVHSSSMQFLETV